MFSMKKPVSEEETELFLNLWIYYRRAQDTASRFKPGKIITGTAATVCKAPLDKNILKDGII